MRPADRLVRMVRRQLQFIRREPMFRHAKETNMGTTSRYVTDLISWNLPRVEALEERLLEELITKTRGKALRPEVLGEELYSAFLDRLREIAGVVVNETIEYWLKGLTDGLDGTFPELCVEFPYLQHKESVDALTMDYCVDNQDGTRTRLNRTNMRTALTRLMERNHEGTSVERRLAKVVGAELRALAQQLEGQPLRSVPTRTR
jgi:hypothetical protein